MNTYSAHFFAKSVIENRYSVQKVSFEDVSEGELFIFADVRFVKVPPQSVGDFTINAINLEDPDDRDYFFAESDLVHSWMYIYLKSVFPRV